MHREDAHGFNGQQLGRSKNSAQSAACKSNLRQLRTRLLMFLSDNHCYPVNAFQTKPCDNPVYFRPVL